MSPTLGTKVWNVDIDIDAAGIQRLHTADIGMGSWWRSREMKYVSLILSEDAAHECVHGLGEIGALQFTDLNLEQTPFQRRYVNYVKR